LKGNEESSLSGFSNFDDQQFKHGASNITKEKINLKLENNLQKIIKKGINLIL